MKRFSLAVVVFVLAVSGLAFAAQSTDEKQHSAVMDQSMMNHMIGEAKDGKGSGDHMMRMINMMEQCSAVMGFAKNSDGTKDSQKQ